MTNTAVTEIVMPTNLTPGPSPKERGVVLAPNPVINLLSVSLSPPPPKADRVGLVVYDLFGREVFKSQIVNPKSLFSSNYFGSVSLSFAAVRFLAQNPMHGISPGRARRGITSVSPRPPGPQHAGLRC